MESGVESAVVNTDSLDVAVVGSGRDAELAGHTRSAAQS